MKASRFIHNLCFILNVQSEIKWKTCVEIIDFSFKLCEIYSLLLREIMIFLLRNYRAYE